MTAFEIFDIIAVVLGTLIIVACAAAGWAVEHLDQATATRHHRSDHTLAS